MRRIRSKTASFDGCERGSVAVVFGLALIPMLGMVGAALDFGRAARIREVQQSIADATALYGASADTASVAALALGFAQDELLRRLGDRSATGGYAVTGAWIDGANYRVTITSAMRTAMIHLLPGAPDDIVIRTVTTVNRIPPATRRRRRRSPSCLPTPRTTTGSTSTAIPPIPSARRRRTGGGGSSRRSPTTRRRPPITAVRRRRNARRTRLRATCCATCAMPAPTRRSGTTRGRAPTCTTATSALIRAPGSRPSA